MKRLKIAICITSFNAEKYIIECVDSFKRQVVPKSWEIVFYIGVDFCEKTARILEKNKIPYFWSNRNVGTYILTNSLLKEAKNDGCDIFLRFDSDDIASRGFLIDGIGNAINTGFSSCFARDFSEEGDRRIFKDFSRYGVGQVFFTRDVLDKLGGYHEYRVACDSYFVKRAERLGIVDKSPKIRPVFLRRNVKGSLSRSKKTGMGSDFRKEVCQILDEKIKNRKYIKIENPVTVDLEYRDPKIPRKISVHFFVHPDRRSNLKIICDKYENYDIIDDIVVVTGENVETPKNYKKTKFIKIGGPYNYGSWPFNGLMSRFLYAQSCKNKYIFIQDDDHYYHESTIKKMLDLKEPLVGTHTTTRWFYNNQYTNQKPKMFGKNKAEIILTGGVLINSSFLPNILELAKNFWGEKYHKVFSGEDIFMSRAVTYITGLKSFSFVPEKCVPLSNHKVQLFLNHHTIQSRTEICSEIYKYFENL